MKLQPEKKLNCCFFLLCLLTELRAQLCRTPCYCPWIPQRCPPGVPLVMDGCGCCRICARRLGEACNQVHVCDHSQGLFCDYSAGYVGRRGACNFKEVGGCELNGKIYKEGEVFQPSCKFQCQCSDGGLTCVPLCSEDVRLPTVDCPHPKRVQIPGRCCQEWICEGQEDRISNEPVMASRLHEAASHGSAGMCEERGTEWSACSTSCGMGISVRVSNQNQHCRLENQSRLCMIRPCSPLRTTKTRGARCHPTVIPSASIRFEYQDCASTSTYAPIFCGFCGHRQCIPYQSRDELIDFNCSGGRPRKIKMMFIISCVCP
ncbi:WNT1-inducible-signaling pathway protein 2 [Rhinatrema bivittatum]|uniref:WNT1-inducible-signaling pathway protein 2 n=1 Tax=Rhinatrema bivittatum TaxID=194408 RepID=UPI00112697FB|nr:WNT1-inducible-signaling pathway protein 2 [Rhinatrema bivittatum]